MGEKITAVVGTVLAWGRQSAGYSVQDVAVHMNKPEAAIAGWESGQDHPTYAQLEKLARFYGRPLAVFFYPEPPEEITPKRAFRSLPQHELDALAPDTIFGIREAHARQLTLRDITNGQNPAGRLIFRDLSPSRRTTPKELAARVREYLGVSLATQTRWTKDDDAFKAWREAVENVGVFVFKRSFKQLEFSGFCLNDDTFPVIMINNKTTFTRQVFTLFHELGHILFDMSGVTLDDESYIDEMSEDARTIEVKCNAFANAVLVPPDDFDAALDRHSTSDADVARLARRYSVSREVILRCLLNRGLITAGEYAARRPSYIRAGAGGSGNYYFTRLSYLGPNFLRLAFAARDSGRMTSAELADSIGIRGRNLARLETTLYEQGS